MHRDVDASRMPRWLRTTLALLTLAVFINYVDRGNLATAAPLIKNELGITATQLGMLLTAFFVTYMPMQIVVGWLTDRVGARHVLLAGFIVWSVATSLTGLARGLAALIMLRLLLGIGESVFFPSSSSMLARHVPEHHRGTANAVLMAGMACGPAFGIFFGGLLIAAYGWRPFFIGFGLASLLWIVPWLAIAQGRLAGNRARDTELPPSLRSILREPSLWGASTGHFCQAFAWYFVLTWLPYYLVHERHWSMAQMATIGGSAYLVMATSMMLTGWIADRRIAAGSSPTVVRKVPLGIGHVWVAVCLIGCVAAPDATLSVLWLLLTGIGLGLIIPNMFAVAQTLAGTGAAGRWMGVQNCIGNWAGIIAPVLTGVLVDRTGSFALPFMIAGGLSIVGGVAWVFGVGPVSQIDWSLRSSRIVPGAPAAVPTR